MISKSKIRIFQWTTVILIFQTYYESIQTQMLQWQHVPLGILKVDCNIIKKSIMHNKNASLFGFCFFLIIYHRIMGIPHVVE